MELTMMLESVTYYEIEIHACRKSTKGWKTLQLMKN